MSKRLCTILTIGYHLLFLGGSTTMITGYLDKIDILKKEIEVQGNRAVKVVDNVAKAGNNIGSSVKKLDESVKKISEDLNKVKKACKRLF